MSTPPIRPATTEERVVALVGRGLNAAGDGRLEEAIGLLEKALELRPVDAETWNSLGVVLVRQGETSRGVDAFRQALRVQPNHAEAHRNLAVVLDRQGQLREAVIHYRAFLHLSSESQVGRADVRRRLAEVSTLNSSADEPR